MMISLLSKRKVSSLHGDGWEGIFDCVDEWRRSAERVEEGLIVGIGIGIGDAGGFDDGDMLAVDVDSSDVDSNGGSDNANIIGGSRDPDSSFVLGGVAGHGRDGYRISPTTEVEGDHRQAASGVLNSPSGLAFAEGFVDDNDANEENDEVESDVEGEAGIDMYMPVDKKKRRKKGKKRVLKKKKAGSRCEKTKKMAIGRVAVNRAANVDLEIPPFPSSPGLHAICNTKPKAKTSTKSPRTDKARLKGTAVKETGLRCNPNRASGSQSDPEEAPYMSLSVPEFEKVLFGPGSKNKGVRALVGGSIVSERRGSGRSGKVRKKGKRKASSASGSSKEESVVSEFVLDGRVGERAPRQVHHIPSVVTTTQMLRGEIERAEMLQARVESGEEDGDGGGDDAGDGGGQQNVLMKLESMIKAMSNELGDLESQMVRQKEKKVGRRGRENHISAKATNMGGFGTEFEDDYVFEEEEEGEGDEREGLIQEISTQVAGKLKKMWDDQDE